MLSTLPNEFMNERVGARCPSILYGKSHLVNYNDRKEDNNKKLKFLSISNL